MLSGSKQLTLPLPRGVRIKTQAGELKIIRPWLSQQSFLALLILTVFTAGLLGGGAAILVRDGALVVGLALLGGGLIALYLLLTTLINRSTITVTTKAMVIRHGPIPVPLWANQRFEAGEIQQLYVAETNIGNKNSASYRYNLHLMTADGQTVPLFSAAIFTEAAQVLYLEQEIERYLGLPDQHLEAEPTRRLLDPLQGVKRAAWQKLANHHQLDFVQRSSLKGAYVSGRYRGYSLELDTVSKKVGLDDEVYTRLLLSVDEPAPLSAPVAPAQVAHILGPAGTWPPLKGVITVEPGGRQVYYEQVGVEGDEGYLQQLFDKLHALLEAYPQVVALGGEVVADLEPIINDEAHPLHAIAAQWLEEIAQETTQRLAVQAERLRCSRCLGACVAQSTRLSLLNTVTYYACRSCHQSQQFFEFKGQIVAVLDRTMTQEQVTVGETVWVNWLKRRDLFSFDAVEIVLATDEEVERFAVQIGNDTDPARQPRYQTMPCLISADCPLSENTLRILRRTFGEVKL